MVTSTGWHELSRLISDLLGETLLLQSTFDNFTEVLVLNVLDALISDNVGREDAISVALLRLNDALLPG